MYTTHSSGKRTKTCLHTMRGDKGLICNMYPNDGMIVAGRGGWNIGRKGLKG